MTINSICVFCGAQDVVDDKFKRIGQEVGTAIAEAKKRLVYGGANCGVMGAVANSALAAGGNVYGVFPRFLRNFEEEHDALSEIVMVDTMHERKQKMYDASDAFVILPGGFGTMDEMFEILTWRQLNQHGKPVYIYNYDGYWDHLIALMDHIITQKFAREVTRDLYDYTGDFAQLKQWLTL
ncbi:MAG: TIGR00730 family Rossman fold protein [Rickettsiales bacterium]|nr:TIGR00730 family Rossman fold protein [Rickettsiales bacterium]|tara:strand:+ start:3425 stop:3967 length:543 start_codon:yes stop_codon:yes gene_type:complete